MDCKHCGRSFGSAKALGGHEPTCTGTNWHTVAGKMLSGYDGSAVYVLTLKRDGDIFKYVGQTSDVRSRLIAHLRKKGVRFFRGADIVQDGNYEVCDIDIVRVEDREVRKVVERDMFIKAANKYGNRALGGH